MHRQGTARSAGLAAYRNGDYAESVARLREVVAGDHDDLEAVSYLGAAYSWLNQHDEAIQVLLRVIKDQPDDARAYYNLGVALAHAMNDAAAVEAFNKALTLCPAYTRPRRALAALHAISTEARE